MLEKSTIDVLQITGETTIIWSPLQEPPIECSQTDNVRWLNGNDQIQYVASTTSSNLSALIQTSYVLLSRFVAIKIETVFLNLPCGGCAM